MTIESADIKRFLENLSPSLAASEEPPAWPPDAFALAGSLLHESGAYLRVVRQWPPEGAAEEGRLDTSAEEWGKEIKRIGLEWRRAWLEGELPEEVVHWWRLLRDEQTLEVSQIKASERVSGALLHLCAAADEASVGVGIVQEDPDDFDWATRFLLLKEPEAGATLCREIDPLRARVLPKFHTPQAGITLRSLTHHLALWQAGDVTPRWYMIPWEARGEESDESEKNVESGDREGLNILLAPWPMAMTPLRFGPAEPISGQLSNMPPQFGFFVYRKPSDPETVRRYLVDLIKAAKESHGQIDAVVLPELALDVEEHRKVKDEIAEAGAILVCGVSEASENGEPDKNYVAIEIPTVLSEEKQRVNVIQHKHHRWCLDKSQIRQYGLGRQLSPERSWWEYSDTEDRTLAFISLSGWLTLCVLVCEDLARQEPVARLVRSVGPNLVIALLMDGPQLPARWSGRYATVLAEDPGSSVLTLTSVGMSELSWPPGVAAPSRAIALWKDAKTGQAKQIDLPHDAHGVLLNVAPEWDEEWTADGRSDGGQAGYPTLAGIHPIRISK